MSDSDNDKKKKKSKSAKKKVYDKRHLNPGRPQGSKKLTSYISNSSGSEDSIDRKEKKKNNKNISDDEENIPMRKKNYRDQNKDDDIPRIPRRETSRMLNENYYQEQSNPPQLLFQLQNQLRQQQMQPPQIPLQQIPNNTPPNNEKKVPLCKKHSCILCNDQEIIDSAEIIKIRKNVIDKVGLFVDSIKDTNMIDQTSLIRAQFFETIMKTLTLYT
jgi:hypothetical protein